MVGKIKKWDPPECRLFWPVAVVFVIGCLVVGCGYHIRANGLPVGVEIESLAIPLIESTSSTMGFEADFTKIIREEFISHAQVALVPVSKAQTVLSGTIREITTDSLTYDSRDVAVEGYLKTYSVTSGRRLKIKLDMRLKDRATGKIIWRDGGMEEKAGFAVGNDPLRNRYNQQKAIEEIARKLAKRIYLKTMERF